MIRVAVDVGRQRRFLPAPDAMTVLKPKSRPRVGKLRKGLRLGPGTYTAAIPAVAQVMTPVAARRALLRRAIKAGLKAELRADGNAGPGADARAPAPPSTPAPGKSSSQRPPREPSRQPSGQSEGRPTGQSAFAAEKRAVKAVLVREQAKQERRLKVLLRAKRRGGVRSTINFRKFWLHLMRGDHAAGEAMLDDLLRCYRPQQLYLRLLVPTLALSGTLFALGRITYHDEHRVTWSCVRLLRRLRRHLPPAPAGTRVRVALATGVGQESHRIGLRMVCDLMAPAGWKSYFLSTNDRGTLHEAIRRLKPDALLLSVGRVQNFDAAARLVAEARRAGFTGPVAAGGRAVAEQPDALTRIGATVTARNGLELVRKLSQKV